MTYYLEEKNETDPLVVGVVFPSFDVPKVVCHTRVRDFNTDLQR